MYDQKGVILVLSGPSGVGKGTICREAVKKDPNAQIAISATTRAPREGEADGRDYYFLSPSVFHERMANGEFLETNEYCGNWYGTLKSEVLRITESGKDCILEIDVHGGINAKKIFPDITLVMVVPPTIETLYHRLKKRGTESEQVMIKRLHEAQSELLYMDQYDYLLVNDDLETAVSDFAAIRRAVRMTVSHNASLRESLLKDSK